MVDHLRTFDPTTLPPLVIPYLSAPEFEDEIQNIDQFYKYPFIKGFSRDLRDSKLDTRGKTERQIVGFLQNWLYFGVLHVFMSLHRLRMVRRDFIQIGSVGDTITSKSLHAYLARWVHAETDGYIRTSARLRQTKELLGYVGAAISQLSDDREELYLPEIFTSIRAMAFTITTTLKTRWPNDFMGFGFEFHISSRCDIILNHIKAQNWCPYDIRQLEPNIGLAYYCLTHKPPRHRFTHARCSAITCRALNVNGANCRTKHCKPYCYCREVEVPQEELRVLLRRNCIPLVRYVPGSMPFSAGTIEVVKNDGTIPNVAFSHVWAGGLGNKKNALPKCQLQRLQELVNQVYNSHSPVAFYLDTLCVPKDKYYRDLAIRKMRDVYKEAGVVLVLDSDIEQVSSLDDFATVGVAISFSGWMTRLWTLQESALNRNLLFRLRDSFLSAESIRRWLRDMRTSWDEDTVAFSTLSQFTYCTDILNDPNPDLSLARVCDALVNRATSHLEDETVCICTLLGIDPQLVLNTDASERMKILLKMIKRIPTPLLIYSGDRFTEHGFRWTPRSLLGYSENQLRGPLGHWYSEMLESFRQIHISFEDKVDKFAKILPSGAVQFSAPGFLVDGTFEKKTGPTFWILHSHGFQLRRNRGSTLFARDFYRVTFVKDEHGMPDPLEGCLFSIIIVEDFRSLDTSTSRPDLLKVLARGILVVFDKVEDASNNFLQCNYYCRVSIHREGDFSSVERNREVHNEILGQDFMLAGKICSKKWIVH